LYYLAVKPSAAEAVDHHIYKGWFSVVLFALIFGKLVYQVF